ncbi:MAG: chemotaxis response regulator protein-glutamate methylesterase [Archaeoglobaceae archaeon]
MVDDSKFMRTIIADILNSDPELEVIGEAEDGEKAIELIKLLKPDIVTMDVEMPKMDGIAALKEIRKSVNPPAVLMLSAKTQDGADATLEALELGAVDFIPKPSGTVSPDLRRNGVDIIEKVKTAAKVKIPHSAEVEPIKESVKPLEKLLVIGASTGGPPIIEKILSKLPLSARFRIVVVQHMPRDFTFRFSNRLNSISEYFVKEAEDGDMVKPGYALVAPGDYHVVLEKRDNGIFVKLNRDTPINNVRPSLEPTLISASRADGDKTIAIILTGMGKDGQVGVQFIKKSGGKVIAQNKETSIVFGMPKRAIETGCVDIVADISGIVYNILKLAGDKNGP